MTPAHKISGRAWSEFSDGIPWWTALAALALAAGCAAGEPLQPTPPSSAEPVAPAAAAGAAQETDFTGLWEGTSTASCMPLQPDARRCKAVVKITLSIFQQGSTLTGHYTCAPGNMVCRDSNTTGTIAAGKVRKGGAGMRVMLPDGSSCLFNGRRAHATMTGAYFCMQGGGYIEQGSFQLQRSY